MHIHRRQFLKYCIGSAAALGLPMNVVGKLEEALAADAGTLPKVIWLNAANCTGCTVSLANLFSDTAPIDVADLLINTIDLVFHPTLMAAAGDLAVQQLQDAAQGSFILAVEGGIPTAFDGHACILWSENGQDVTAMEAVQTLAPKAAAVLSIGTCASFGGIPAASPNPTGIVDVSQLTGVSTVNLPGCPTHPDWVVWTIANLLAGEKISLDSQDRPRTFYGDSVHNNCPNRNRGAAQTFGEPNKCLKALGCKGPEGRADCPLRKWNSGTNWCIGAGSICIGCTLSDFPDGQSPFYKVAYDYQLFDKSGSQDSTPTDPSATSLSITSAVWQQKKATLNVDGIGGSGTIVTIYDSGTGSQLGAVSVNSSGNWSFRQRANKASVPTQVQAVSSDGQEVSASVTQN